MLNSQNYAWPGLMLILSLTLLSCERLRMEPVKNEAGEIVKLTPLWQMPLHEQGPTSNSIVDAHLVFDQKVLIATTHGPDQRALTCVDVQSGEPLWQWDDIYHPPHEKFSVRDAYINDGTLVYFSGGRHYAIDLETGETKWKYFRSMALNSRLCGLSNTAWATGDPVDTLEGYRTGIVYECQTSNGRLEPLLFPDIDFNTGGEANTVTSLAEVEVIQSAGKTFLALISTDPFPNWYYSVMLGLYDYEARTWVYDRIEVSPPSQYNAGIFVREYEEKIYVSAGNRISCHDLWTGERQWRHAFPRDFLFSGFIVEEGLVVANCEDKVLYGLDAETGVQRWRGEGAGTSSFLEGRYLNGIVYFSGGSSSRIHAVDIQTGETVWRLDPGEIEEGALDWKPDIYVVPGENGEKGRVIACTPQNAYCFEAYR